MRWLSKSCRFKTKENQTRFDVPGGIMRDKTKWQSSFIKLLSAVRNAKRERESGGTKQLNNDYN